MNPCDFGYGAILAAVTSRFGITLDPIDSGGGWMILQARLEGDLWLWITDFDANILTMTRRRRAEAAGIAVGYHIAIYPTNYTFDGNSGPDYYTRLAGVDHRTAAAETLPDLIELTLRSIAGNQQHHIDATGTHTVTIGIVAV